MTEYRIVAKLDPSGVTAGSQKVKQDLQGIDASTAGLQTSLDRLAASVEKNTAAMGRTGNETRKTAQSQGQMESSTQRVLQAVDREAAELAKLNKLLDEARRLHAAGAISGDQFAKVQGLVTNGVNRANVSIAQQRAGYTQLGFQVQDITQTMALGINPLVVLAQQGGQTASAIALAVGENGALGRAATFMAGPWGSIIIAATAVLGTFLLKNLELGDALDEEVEKLKKDADETEISRQAKLIYQGTLEAVTVSIRENAKALEELAKGQRSAAAQALDLAFKNKLTLEASRARTQANIDEARSILALEQASDIGFSGQQYIEREGRINERATLLQGLEERLKKTDQEIAKANQNVEVGKTLLAVEIGMRSESEKITDTYARRIDKRREELRLAGASVSKIREETEALRQKRDAAIDAANKANNATRRSDGVATFKSQRQALQVAGREFQQDGLRVSEGLDFGGIKKGAHKSSHVNAIDVDVAGASDSAQTPPDIRSKYDAVAKRYAARGYKVLWAGKVYHPDGKITAITGSDKHYGHMHVEAPGTIVGKATQASTEALANREENTAEQKADFVQQIVDQNAARGTGGGIVQTTETKIASVLAAYKRRFNEELAGPQADALRQSFTDADAREIAQRFDEAYVYPLNRLSALQGKVGLEREIMAAQLARSEEQFGPVTAGVNMLTEAENKQIEAFYRQNDQMERQKQILDEVFGPVEEYKAEIAALTVLLNNAKLSQEQFNQRVNDLALNKAGREQDQRLGLAPSGALAEIETQKSSDDLLNQQRRDAELSQAQGHYEKMLQAEMNYLRRSAAIQQAYDNAKRDVTLGSAEELFGSLTSIAENALGKQNAVYKAMFAAEKAVAIARSVVAIQEGIAQAAKLPFPANLGAIASVVAATASIIANIKAVQLELASGGYVSGPGGPRDDKIPARLSNGEFVVNADATARNRALLEAINSGSTTARTKEMARAPSSVTRAGGGDSYAFQFGDVVVQVPEGTTGRDGEMIGRAVKDQINSIVDERLMASRRAGGILTRPRESVLSGG